MPMNKAQKRDYMRGYMARAYFYAKERPRLVACTDKDGCVRVRMTATLRLRYLDLRSGEVRTLPWQTAAQLLAGRFAELAKADAPASQAKPSAARKGQALTEALRAINYAAGALKRTVRKGKPDAS